MADLYTVRMHRKQIVSIFDTRGRKVREEHRLLEQIYTDLPYVAAVSYQTQFPDNNVRIERQIPDYTPQSRRKHSVRSTGIAEYSPRKRASAETTSAPHEEAPVAHDYTALVNTMMKEESDR